MIRYTLKCADGHSFDSWFKSTQAFEALESRGMLSCSICGSGDVRKAMMAPPVATSGPEKQSAAEAEPVVKLSAPQSPVEEALMALRKHVEENSTYVGDSFAREARKIHLGEAPERLIHGEARPEEAKALIEDGVPVTPLPIIPKNRST